MDVPYFVYPFILLWTSGSFLPFGCCNADSIILRLLVFGSGTGFLGLSEHVATLLLLGCMCSVPAVSRILVPNLRGQLYLSGMYTMAQGHMVSLWLVESILGSGECAQKGKGYCLGLGPLPLNKNRSWVTPG